MASRTIYCIGNPVLASDNLALKLADSLEIEGCTFEKVFSPEELFDEQAEELIIMDVAMGIEKIEILTDLSKLKHRKLLSLHDFDLQYFIKLMEKMGTLPGITLIALPIEMTEEQAQQALPEVLQSLYPQSTSRKCVEQEKHGS